MRYAWIILPVLLSSIAVAGVAEATQDVTVVTKPTEEKGEVFMLPDMGWRDPFVDPRDAMRSSVGEDAIQDAVVGEPRTILQKALDALPVESIIGLDVDDNLSAVIGGTTVRAGDTVTGESLKFKVDRITKDLVYLRCLTEDEKLERLHNFVVKKRIGN